MALTPQNFTWQQGEDLIIKLKYKEGNTPETAAIVDLSTGYDLRMDVVASDDKTRLYTFNTSALADVDPGAGTVPDNTLEGTLSSGAGDTPNIEILVPRSLTLPGGEIEARMSGANPITSFFYDVFLRNTTSGRQQKILTGTITVERSHTLWQ